MPKSGTEKRLDYEKRYKQFILLIIKYQSLFEKIIAPLLTEEQINQFFSQFSYDENIIMDWIENNKEYYLKKITEGLT